MAYIMVVDDDEDFASAAATALQAGGHEVEVQLGTAEALEAMKRRRPDLVVLDVMFPGRSSAGFELARTMRREGLDRTPIVMLTAVNREFPLGFSPADIDEQWMPVTDFLEKPVDFDELKAKVAGLVG